MVSLFVQLVKALGSIGVMEMQMRAKGGNSGLGFR